MAPDMSGILVNGDVPIFISSNTLPVIELMSMYTFSPHLVLNLIPLQGTSFCLALPTLQWIQFTHETVNLIQSLFEVVLVLSSPE